MAKIMQRARYVLQSRRATRNLREHLPNDDVTFLSLAALEHDVLGPVRLRER